ncbi:MAG: dihydroorotate dehydrogenase [Chloroflexi bacterium]|nr:dihydroorotate dehydrogenase [Chloroflexota bacterium]MBL7061789.1 dihydroorotate dehydrogenase [Dehalococcoidia bacterium]
MVDLSIQLAPAHKRGLLLANPVMTASGTFGYGIEYSELVDIKKLGAIVCKGTTLKPRKGNPQPRLVEKAWGILNSVGLENVGVEAVIKDKAPIWAKWQVPVIVNIAGETIDEYAEVAARLDGVAGVSGIEVNISCPNIASGGMEFSTNPESAAEVTAAVRAVSSLPVIVKLSPNVTDIGEIALAVSKAGADAITLINTVRGMAIDINESRPSLGNFVGGFSGPAIKPIALYMVYKVAGIVDIPIIGCGGISCADDALEFLMAGASAVQVGTANLTNPQATLDVLEGIKQFMKRENLKNMETIVGKARS